MLTDRVPSLGRVSPHLRVGRLMCSKLEAVKSLPFNQQHARPAKLAVNKRSVSNRMMEI